MLKSKKFGSRLADVIIWGVVIIITAACLFPLINMVAISFSNKSAAAGNLVGLLPIDFTLSSYKTLLKEGQFWRSFGISVLRVVLGTALNLILVVLMAYPLSKSKREFRFRNIYMNFMIFAMLFSGGMIQYLLL